MMETTGVKKSYIGDIDVTESIDTSGSAITEDSEVGVLDSKRWQRFRQKMGMSDPFTVNGGMRGHQRNRVELNNKGPLSREVESASAPSNPTAAVSDSPAVTARNVKGMRTNSMNTATTASESSDDSSELDVLSSPNWRAYRHKVSGTLQSFSPPHTVHTVEAGGPPPWLSPPGTWKPNRTPPNSTGSFADSSSTTDSGSSSTSWSTPGSTSPTTQTKEALSPQSTTTTSTLDEDNNNNNNNTTTQEDEKAGESPSLTAAVLDYTEQLVSTLDNSPGGSSSEATKHEIVDTASTNGTRSPLSQQHQQTSINKPKPSTRPFSHSNPKPPVRTLSSASEASIEISPGHSPKFSDKQMERSISNDETPIAGSLSGKKAIQSLPQFTPLTSGDESFSDSRPAYVIPGHRSQLPSNLCLEGSSDHSNASISSTASLSANQLPSTVLKSARSLLDSGVDSYIYDSAGLDPDSKSSLDFNAAPRPRLSSSSWAGGTITDEKANSSSEEFDIASVADPLTMRSLDSWGRATLDRESESRAGSLESIEQTSLKSRQSSGSWGKAELSSDHISAESLDETLNSSKSPRKLPSYLTSWANLSETMFDDVVPEKAPNERMQSLPTLTEEKSEKKSLARIRRPAPARGVNRMASWSSGNASIDGTRESLLGKADRLLNGDENEDDVHGADEQISSWSTMDMLLQKKEEKKESDPSKEETDPSKKAGHNENPVANARKPKGEQTFRTPLRQRSKRMVRELRRVHSNRSFRKNRPKSDTDDSAQAGPATEQHLDALENSWTEKPSEDKQVMTSAPRETTSEVSRGSEATARSHESEATTERSIAGVDKRDGVPPQEHSADDSSVQMDEHGTPGKASDVEMEGHIEAGTGNTIRGESSSGVLQENPLSAPMPPMTGEELKSNRNRVVDETSEKRSIVFEVPVEAAPGTKNKNHLKTTQANPAPRSTGGLKSALKQSNDINAKPPKSALKHTRRYDNGRGKMPEPDKAGGPTAERQDDIEVGMDASQKRKSAMKDYDVKSISSRSNRSKSSVDRSNRSKRSKSSVDRSNRSKRSKRSNSSRRSKMLKRLSTSKTTIGADGKVQFADEDDVESMSITSWHEEKMCMKREIVCRMWLVFAVLFIVTLVFSIRDRDGGEIAPTMAPTGSLRTAAPTNQELIRLPADTMRAITIDPTSPQAQAYEWALGDPNFDTYTEMRKQQRFALVTLYFSTRGSDWIDHSNEPSYFDDECFWFEGPTPYIEGKCDDNGEYLSLSLVGNNMMGTIPLEVGLLTSLTALDFGFNSLVGTIPPQLQFMSNLTSIYLESNSITGSIPSEIGRLVRMKHLNLASNKLTGAIPVEMGELSNLETMDLNSNIFNHPCPSELGMISSLKVLNLMNASLTGTIITQVGNLSALETLVLSDNQLEGSMPSELMALTQLTYLHMDGNQLTGTINPELGSLRLLDLSLARNALTGQFPRQLGALTNLVRLDCSGNMLNESIPTVIGNLSKLEDISLSANRFTGFLPTELGKLELLTDMRLSGNSLVGTIPSQVGLLQQLSRLDVADNNLNGIPTEIGRLQQLEVLWLSRNIFVNFPSEMGNLQKLTELWMDDNDVVSTIPTEVGELSNLQRLMLGNNMFSGSIPTEFSLLSSLREFSLSGNHNMSLNEFPQMLLDLQNLEGLWLDETNLQGSIPAEIGTLANLINLHLENNALSGSLPESLGNATKLRRFEVSGNILSGQLPSSLGHLKELERLSLGDNKLTLLSIPSSIYDLANLTALDLSKARLVGTLPAQKLLGSLSNLQVLNLNDNAIKGELPPSLGNATQLTILKLAWNLFTGEIPTELGLLTNLLEFELHGNFLDGPIPEEVTSLPLLELVTINSTAVIGSLSDDFCENLGSPFFCTPYFCDCGCTC